MILFFSLLNKTEINEEYVDHGFMFFFKFPSPYEKRKHLTK